MTDPSFTRTSEVQLYYRSWLYFKLYSMNRIIVYIILLSGYFKQYRAKKKKYGEIERYP